MLENQRARDHGCCQQPCKHSVCEQVGDLTATSSGSDPSMHLVKIPGNDCATSAQVFVPLQATFWL
jgi:hypothetical protein